MKQRFHFEAEPFEVYSEFDEENGGFDAELAELLGEVKQGRRSLFRRPLPRPTRRRVRPRAGSPAVRPPRPTAVPPARPPVKRPGKTRSTPPFVPVPQSIVIDTWPPVEPPAPVPPKPEPSVLQPPTSEPGPPSGPTSGTEPEPSTALPSDIEPEPVPPVSEPSTGSAAAQKTAPATNFFKDTPHLQSVPLPPSTPIGISNAWPSVRQMIATTYNRLGGLMRALAKEANIEVQTALGVWYVESGGRTHIVNQAIIRFENHLFYRHWGKYHPEIYNRHFRHGGHNDEPGRAWQNHKFRENVNEPFRTFHGNQSLEYRVLALAKQLAGEATTLLAISIGGPQILIANYRLLGFSSPQEMFNVFQAGERAHVFGFFDYCRHRRAPREGDLLAYLQNRDWVNFARHYNGPGLIEKYSGRIRNAYEHVRQLPV